MDDTPADVDDPSDESLTELVNYLTPRRDNEMIATYRNRRSMIERAPQNTQIEDIKQAEEAGNRRGDATRGVREARFESRERNRTHNRR